MQSFELVVIGAGVHGLGAARSYLGVHPTAKLIIVDTATSLGGVWAEERLYPGLKTNNLMGTYEYSDFPMDPAVFAAKPGHHIDGRVINHYLSAYAKEFALEQRLMLSTKVESAEHKQAGGWLLTAVRDGQTTINIHADKLIVATGLTSQPFMPNFRGQDAYQGQLFHVKDLARHADSLTGRVTIFGGSKSAYDAVYALASKGVKVDWIIRESGHGPAWMSPMRITPLKIWLEMLVSARLVTWMSPCIWGSKDGFPGMRRFFNRTALGRFLVQCFWTIVRWDIMTACKWSSHPETAKLEPWTDVFYSATNLSILNYPTNVYEYVHDGTVSIHVADIQELGSTSVQLSNGTALTSDAFISCTGWQKVPPIQFLPDGLDRELGIPHRRPADDNSITDATADGEILAQLPLLQKQPTLKNLTPMNAADGRSDPRENIQPFKLFRFMIPPSQELMQKRDIAFAGMMMSFSTTLLAQTQGLWIAAYMSNRLDLDLASKSNSELLYEATLHARNCRWRYPCGFGSSYPDIVLDCLPYIDMLLADLGLKFHRKPNLFREICEPYMPVHYAGLIAEWQNVQKARL